MRAGANGENIVVGEAIGVSGSMIVRLELGDLCVQLRYPFH